MTTGWFAYKMMTDSIRDSQEREDDYRERAALQQGQHYSEMDYVPGASGGVGYFTYEDAEPELSDQEYIWKLEDEIAELTYQVGRLKRKLKRKKNGKG